MSTVQQYYLLRLLVPDNFNQNKLLVCLTELQYCTWLFTQRVARLKWLDLPLLDYRLDEVQPLQTDQAMATFINFSSTHQQLIKTLNLLAPVTSPPNSVQGELPLYT